MESPVLRRYEIEELLSLRDSPLIQKPAGLPPIEEWMGTTPIRPQTTRSRTDGDSLLANHEDGAKIGMTSTRRPSLFEARHLSRPSLADDIVLGPPKMMFASSSTRTPSGKFDHDSQVASLASPLIDEDRESPRFERFRMGGNTRLGKEMDKDRPERSGLRSDHTKRGFGREDSEGWTSVASRQPRKSFGAEDGDRFRGAGERGKRETPWDKDRPPKYDNFGREREHRPRGRRDEASWLLEDRGIERGGDRDHYRDRDHHRYNSNSNRNEKDPEWMDSGPGNEDKTGDSKTVHSMEEFQRWKERMKASNAPEDKKIRVEAPAETVGRDKFPKEPKGGQQSPKDAENTHFAVEEPATAPAVVENGVDRFFGLWGAPSASKSPEQDTLGNARPETKTAVKSRFTSFFGPQEPVSPNIPESPIAAKIPTPANESSSEDKEGFQRILKILSGVSLGSSEPVSVPSSGMTRPPLPSISPLASLMSSHPPPSHSQQAPVTSPPHRDANADFLMRLMHQSHQSQQNQAQAPPPPPPLHTPYGGPSQMPPPPPISTSPHNFQRAKNNPLSPAFDDPAITAFRQRSNQEPTSPILPRGPPLIEQHGPPGGWNHHHHQQQQQQLSQQQQPPPPNHRQVAPPPGFARSQQQQQQHHQGPPPPPFLGPPPGVNGPPPMPFALGPPLTMPPNFGPPPPFFGMNGMNGLNGHPPPPPPPPPQMNGPPPQGYHPQFHHPHAEPHGPPIGIHGPPFGFPHDGLKHPQHPHGPGNPRFPNEPLHRQLR